MKLGETYVAAGAVIGHRTVLGAAALTDPLHADHAEFALMSSEKIAAFTSAGQALLDDVETIGRETANFWVSQAVAGLRATLGMAFARSAASALAAQQRWVTETALRTQNYATRVTSLGAGLSGSALAPVHAAATGNARRLAGKKE
jgi:hypothetical protein